MVAEGVAARVDGARATTPGIDGRKSHNALPLGQPRC